MDCLEVLGFARRGGDGDFLGADEGVDGRGLTDVGVADEPDLDLSSGGGFYGWSAGDNGV